MVSKLAVTLLLSMLAICPAVADDAVSALAEAIKAGNLPSVQDAILRGADPDALAGHMPISGLTLAVARGETEIARLLLQQGADPNQPVLQGANALAIAVRSCEAPQEMVDLLLDWGADIENRSGNGLTPLLIAVQDNRTDLVLHLIAKGADVTALSPFGDGILNFAIYNENPDLVQAALDSGAGTGQLAVLFTTVEYDPPGYKGATGHFAGICNDS
jgi:ankyrin repeat protein